MEPVPLLPGPLVLALDSALSLADTRQERWLSAFTRAPQSGADLPLNPAVLDLAQRALQDGHAVFILTENASIAADVAAGAGLQASMIVPDPAKGETRLQAVQGAVGPGPFRFVGHDLADLPLWQAAQGGWCVGPPPVALQRAGVPALVALAGQNPERTASAVWRAMRPHHWIKNLLVFLPLIAAHRWAESTALWGSLLAFVTFCLITSAIYLINDLFDLPDDRKHPTKRHRPLASGALKVPAALWAAGLLALSGLSVGLTLAPTAALAGVALLYATVALIYSRWLKTWRFVDLLGLGVFYTLRVLAGSAATGIAATGWLLALCFSLFLALACAKRAAELTHARLVGTAGIARRRYRLRDLVWVTWLGGISAASAGLVLASYAQSQSAADLYARPPLLNLTAALLMLWVGWIWRNTLRGLMHGDPIIFALRDRASWSLALALAITVRLAVG